MFSSNLCLRTVVVLALCSVLVLAVPYGQAEQRQNDHALNRKRADAVKEAFQYAWDGYYKHAFPHDELHPVSNGSSDSRYRFHIHVYSINLPQAEMDGEQVL